MKYKTEKYFVVTIFFLLFRICRIGTTVILFSVFSRFCLFLKNKVGMVVEMNTFLEIS